MGPLDASSLHFCLLHLCHTSVGDPLCTRSHKRKAGSGRSLCFCPLLYHGLQHTIAASTTAWIEHHCCVFIFARPSTSNMPSCFYKATPSVYGSAGDSHRLKNPFLLLRQDSSRVAHRSQTAKHVQDGLSKHLSIYGPFGFSFSAFCLHHL